MIEINVNEVFRSVKDGAPFAGYARLLRIRDDVAYLIGLPLRSETDKRLDRSRIKAPFTIPLSDLSRALEDGRITGGQAIETDCFFSKGQYDEPAQGRLEERIRIVRSLLSSKDLLTEVFGGEGAFCRSVEDREEGERLLRRLCYIFWAGGQTDDALAPAYHLRGGTGISQKEGSDRRGRRREKGPGRSEVALPQVRDALEAGAKRFYRRGKFTLHEAYVETLEKHFRAEIRALPGGSLKLDKLPVPQLPTLRQFRYVCDLLDRKYGKRKKHPRRSRPEKPEFVRRGRARYKVEGPGFRFEIDATELQVQLVSKYNSAELVGKPTLYLIVDVWSTAITGYAISLYPPSWAVAKRALRNCFTDKNEVFDRLEIGREYWPCRHLPVNLTSDNGELVGHMSKCLQEMGLTDEYSASGRPEGKGTIESVFGRIKHGVLAEVEGAYAKNPQRGESDGKKTAALTIEDIERITVSEIMKYNGDPIPVEHIPLDFRASVPSDISRAGFYAWGLRNRPGFTRELDPRQVTEYLTSRGRASVSQNGLRFEGHLYLSERFCEGNYRLEIQNGRRYVDVRFDEHFANEIFFYDVEKNGWSRAEHENEAVCELLPTFQQLKDHRAEFEELAQFVKTARISNSRDVRKNLIDPIRKNSKKKVKAAREVDSASAGGDNIKTNRQTEQAAERQEERSRTQSPAAQSADDPNCGGLGPKSSYMSDAEKAWTKLSLQVWSKKNG